MKRRARAIWFDLSLTAADAAYEAEVSETTLWRMFGSRTKRKPKRKAK